MHDHNNNGISDKEDLIIMETDEENWLGCKVSRNPKIKIKNNCGL